MLSSRVDAGVGSTSKIKKCPSRGKRYSKAQKEEILNYAKANSVEEAAAKFGATGSSIYEWRRSLKRRGENGGSAEGEIRVEDQAENRDQKIITIGAPITVLVDYWFVQIVFTGCRNKA